jgi:elongation factor G
VETDSLVPGDIGAVAKIEEIQFNDVLHDSHDEDHIRLRSLDFPTPMHSIAVETKKKGDEQRSSTCCTSSRSRTRACGSSAIPPTHETVMRGLGDLHMRTKLEKMKQQYKMEVATKPPKIPYRETVTRRAEGTAATRSRPAARASSARCTSRSSRCSAARASSSRAR